jgi:hypothetical protein
MGMLRKETGNQNAYVGNHHPAHGHAPTTKKRGNQVLALHATAIHGGYIMFVSL